MSSIFQQRFHALINFSRVIAGWLHGFVQLKPDQIVHFVALCKTVNHVFAMLPYPRRKIGSDATLRRAIALAGKYVDTRLTSAHDFDSIFDFIRY